MKKRQLYLVLMFSLLITPLFGLSGAEVPKDFSMVGTWKTENQSPAVTIELKDNHKGLLTVGDLEPVTILKWDVEIAKKGKVYVGLYFYSRDKERFAKRTIKMYNQGSGFKLKALYQPGDYFKVYNGITVKDGKIEHNDGRMELKR